MSEVGQKLIQAIRDAVAENPEFIYRESLQLGGKGCVYVRDGKSSCLVGRGAWDIGLINAEFELNGDNNVCAEELLISALALDLDDLELRWISAVQDQQDDGRTWGEAVQYADELAYAE